MLRQNAKRKRRGQGGVAGPAENTFAAQTTSSRAATPPVARGCAPGDLPEVVLTFAPDLVADVLVGRLAMEAAEAEARARKAREETSPPAQRYRGGESGGAPHIFPTGPCAR